MLLSILVAVPARAQAVREDFFITNGTVNAEALLGDTLYVGGAFTRVGPVTGSGVPLDSNTGLALSGFPRVVGEVHAVVADGAGGWFVGGLFTSVGGQPRSNLAHVLDDQSVSSWDPGANGVVRALALSGATLYVGGDFTGAGGQSRNRIAALDTASGAALGWNPNANSTVRAIAEVGGVVYAGGAFTLIGGQGRNRIAALDGTTGLATAWNPNANSTVFAILPQGGTLYVAGQFTTIGAQARNRIAELNVLTGFATGWNPGANNTVMALAERAGTIYAGGAFTNIGGQGRNRIAALDGTTGLATAWNPNASAQVSALAVSGNTLYAGGDFLSIGGAPRSRIAALEVATGLATPWDPSAYGSVLSLVRQAGTVYAGGTFAGMGGVARNNLAALDVTTGAATSWNPNADNQVLALGVEGGAFYVGGSFANVGGQPRSNIAALDISTGLATSWNPGTNGEVSALLAHSGTVYAGGNFTSAGGQARTNLAQFDATSGLATPWNPNPNGQVFTIARASSPVFVGGIFSNVGGLARNSVAALDPATGFATAWNASANGTVRSIVLSCSRVYLGGFFTSAGGQPRNFVAAVDAGSGLATPWNPNASGPLFAMELQGGRMYVGGVFGAIGGQTRGSIAALDPVTGLATPWNPSSIGTIRTLAVGADEVYAGGSMTSMAGLQVANLAAMEADASFSCPTLTVGPPVLSDGVLGVAYSQSITTSGGTGPFCFEVTTGSLPAGLTLGSGTGVIAGTPGTTGTSVFTIGVTDANGCTGSTGYVVSVFATPPGSLVAANTAGLCVSPAHPCVAVPVEYTRNDSVPARGISVTVQLDVTKLGLCAPGTPASNFHQGTWLSGFTSTFQVVDHGGGVYTVDQAALGSPCGITVGGPLFTMDLTSVGPDGAGAITVLSVQARDCDGVVIPAAPGAQAQLAILNTPIPVLPTTLPAATSGLPYAQTFSAGAGAAPFVWALTAGVLPVGLSLSAAGELTGAPTSLGSFLFAVGVTDVNDCVGSREYTLDVACGALAVLPNALPDGVAGEGYADTLTAVGGIAPVTWAVTAGSLPAGLTLDTGTGVIAGTPGVTGTSVFTIGVSDSNGCTGSTGYVVSVFATPPGSLVAANTAGLCVSPAHPCVAVPVEYTRNDSVPARGISVTVQLDVTKLGLCAPGTPASNFHQGTWLSGFTSTFQVVDHGGGVYTVDQAALGSPCGITVGGPLFTMDLASVGPDGAGAITVQSVSVRDCDGAVIPASPGPVANLTITSVGPTPISDLASAQLRSGNGPGGTTGIVVTWSTGGAGPVSLYRAPFGSYPEYDDGGPVSPPDPNASPGAPWTLVSAAATPGYLDHPPERGFWHYTARVVGDCDVPSAASNLSNGSLNYHLGDVSNGATAGQGDNVVRGVDLSLLGAHYGIMGAQITTQGVAYLDVGPTTDLQATSRPTTDDRIDFDDLMLFALNFDSLVSVPQVAARPAGARPPQARPSGMVVAVAPGAASGGEEFRVVAPALVEAGEVVTAELWLRGGGRIQGFSARLSWDRAVVEVLGMESGQWVEGQGGVVLTPQAGVVDAALLGARGEGMVGEGQVARVRFRGLRAGNAGFRLAGVEVRDRGNRRVEDVGVRVDPLAPGRTVLLSPWPNPVRGGERMELEFSLAETGAVDLVIYGVDGRRVRELVREERAAGVYREGWDGRDEQGQAVASGVYYARLIAGGRQFRQKLVRIR